RAQVLSQGLFLDDRGHVIVEEFTMLRVNLRGFNRHRAVEEDRKGRNLFSPEHQRENAGEQLRPSDGEGGNDDLAAGLRGSLDDFHELIDRFAKRAVVAVAIGGFQEDKIGVGEWLKIAQK